MCSCKCGEEAWCVCMEHTVDSCPGTPVIFGHSEPYHIPDGTVLCPGPHEGAYVKERMGNEYAGCQICDGDGYVEKEVVEVGEKPKNFWQRVDELMEYREISGARLIQLIEEEAHRVRAQEEG